MAAHVCDPGALSVVRAVSDQLGWVGVTVVAVRLLGFAVDVVCEIDSSAHEERVARRLAPAVDPWLFSCLNADNEAFARLPAVRMSGVVARRVQWTSAHAAVASLRAMCPGVAVLPAARLRQTALWDADVSGVGLAVTTGADVELLVPPAPWHAPEPTPMARLLSETVYDAVLRRGSLSTAAA
jgi:hypothetical protein